MLEKKPIVSEMFDNVVNYVGRIYVCHPECERDNITNAENCRGTVGLIGCHGESIGCWHTIDPTTRKENDKIFIEYPNYKQNLIFEAQVKENIFDVELDLFVAEPIEPLTFTTKHLYCAHDVSLADNVHCFGFPEVVDRQIIVGYKNRIKNSTDFVDLDIERKLRLPTIFSGRVCFNGWKQVVADYLSFPNCSGGIVVDDWGHLKGIHVASLGLRQQPNFQNLKVIQCKSKQKGKSKSPKINVEKSLQDLFEEVNTFCAQTTCTLNTSRNEIAAFVPIQIFEKPLQLAHLGQDQQQGEYFPSLINSNLENLKNISNQHFGNERNILNAKLFVSEGTSKAKITNTNLSEYMYLPEEHSDTNDLSEIKQIIHKPKHKKKHGLKHQCRNNDVQKIPLSDKIEVTVENKKNWKMNDIEDKIKQILKRPHYMNKEKGISLRERKKHKEKNEIPQKCNNIMCEQKYHRYTNDSEDLELNMVVREEICNSVGDSLIENMITKNLMRSENDKQKIQEPILRLKKQHPKVVLKRKRRKNNILTLRKCKRQKHESCEFCD